MRIVRSGDNQENELMLTHGLNGIRNARIKYKKRLVVEKITK